jgi:PAS domain S-box-containing protein
MDFSWLMAANPEGTSFRHRNSPALRYGFALAVTAAAAGLAMWSERLGPGLFPPELAAFAGIIVSASWAGFGPGLLSTVTLTVLCVYLSGPGVTGVILRCALFLLEGIAVSVGFGRLRRSMTEAARSKEWHRSLVETSAEGIWILNSSGVITYANPRIAEMLGTVVPALVGRSYQEFVFPADQAIEHVRFSSRQSNTRQQFDRRLRKNDGAELWVLACSNITNIAESRQAGNDEPGVIAMMTDITERKRAEQALRRSEARFRTLFDNVLEGVYQSTPDGRIIAANPMLLRMLGLNSETELNDVNIATDLYVDPEVRRQLLRRLEQDGSFQNVEYELRRRDGNVITVLENARVVRDDDARVLYYEGTLTDVTAHNRTAEQLRRAQRMEAIGRLAGGIAHDFSNILTVITGYSHLVVDALKTSHPARESAEQILRAADGATALTQQLMSFSRRQTHDPVPVDINRVVRQSEADLRDVVGPSVSLRFEMGDEETLVLADAGHLEQILLNMVIRAWSANRPAELVIATGPISLDTGYCRLHPGARPGHWAALRVACVGSAGVDDAAGESAVSAARLGASTTEAIVLQYGGFLLDASTVEGEGAAVYLPLADRVPDARERGSQPEVVLLVEDEPLIRELSRDMLERQGFRVLVAAGPAEAEQISKRSKFDLLITDVTMPEMQGTELARRLRAVRPGLKVLYISGYSEQPLDPLELESSGAGLLQKLFSADSLGRKIRNMMGNR